MDVGTADEDFQKQLKDNIVAICRHKKKFSRELRVQGLLNIMTDNEVIYVVNINEIVESSPSNGAKATGEENAELPKKKKKKRKSQIEAAVERQMKELPQFVAKQIEKHNKRKTELSNAVGISKVPRLVQPNKAVQTPASSASSSSSSAPSSTLASRTIAPNVAQSPRSTAQPTAFCTSTPNIAQSPRLTAQQPARFVHPPLGNTPFRSPFPYASPRGPSTPVHPGAFGTSGGIATTATNVPLVATSATKPRTPQRHQTYTVPVVSGNGLPPSAKSANLVTKHGTSVTSHSDPANVLPMTPRNVPGRATTSSAVTSVQPLVPASPSAPAENQYNQFTVKARQVLKPNMVKDSKTDSFKGVAKPSLCSMPTLEQMCTGLQQKGSKAETSIRKMTSPGQNQLREKRRSVENEKERSSLPVVTSTSTFEATNSRYLAAENDTSAHYDDNESVHEYSDLQTEIPETDDEMNTDKSKTTAESMTDPDENSVIRDIPPEYRTPIPVPECQSVSSSVASSYLGTLLTGVNPSPCSNGRNQSDQRYYHPTPSIPNADPDPFDPVEGLRQWLKIDNANSKHTAEQSDQIIPTTSGAAVLNKDILGSLIMSTSQSPPAIPTPTSPMPLSWSQSSANAVMIAPIDSQQSVGTDDNDDLPRMLRDNTAEERENEGEGSKTTQASTSLDKVENPSKSSPGSSRSPKFSVGNLKTEDEPTKEIIVIEDDDRDEETEDEVAASRGSVGEQNNGSDERQPPPIACDTCGMGYSTPKALERHVSVVHVQPNKLKKALLKSKGTRRLRERKPNEDSEVLLRDRPYGCTYCELSFPSLATLHQHMSKHNLNCPICKTMHNTKKKLRVHMEVLHGQVEVFYCVRCSRCFLSSQGKKTHENGCSGKKMLPCTMCSKSYRSAWFLENHINKNHKGSGYDLVYTCSICKKKFNTCAGHKTHMRFVHRINDKKVAPMSIVKRGTEDGDSRSSDAGKKSAVGKENVKGTPANLPETSQSDDLNYKCPYCSLVFGQKKEKDNHMVVAHLETTTPYQCSQCNVVFTSRKEYGIHIKNIHMTRD